MDEKMKMNGHGEDCSCGMCKGGMGMMGGMCGGCGCGHRHGHGWHLALKVLAIALVFWFGVQFGEMHSYRFGPAMMGGYGGNVYPSSMMQGYYGGYDQGYGPGASVPAGSSITAPAPQQ